MEHEIFLGMNLDQTATEEIKSLAQMPKYYELKPTISHDDLFLVRSFHLDTGVGNSCPCKTLVIFAHNEDFKYTNLPEVVKVANQCLTFNDLKLM